MTDISWMIFSSQHGISISVPVVGDDVSPWVKSQIQIFNTHSISIPAAASTQGYAGITYTGLVIRIGHGSLQQITCVIAHIPANRLQVAAETQDLVTVRGEITLTKANVLETSCFHSLFIDLQVLAFHWPTPNYSGQGLKPHLLGPLCGEWRACPWC